MPAREFVHLHVHSHYSVLDGVCQIEPLVTRVAEQGMNAVALTDHGSMYGAMEFYTKAEKAGVKPILGFEAYVAPGSRHDRGHTGIKDASYHLTLLARDMTGYHNLCELCTAGYLEGFYYRPRIDKEILREHAEGLIGLSGCLSGEIPKCLLAGRTEEAEAAAREYREIFGEENFFLEIMQNGLPEQQEVLEGMGLLSRKTGIPLVASSDVHYLTPAHARVQDVLLCINTGKFLADTNRMRMESEDFYLKSPEEMRAAFAGYEEALERTLAIADRCNLDLSPLLTGYHLPRIEPPEGMTVEAHLDHLCRAGLKERYGDPVPPEATERYGKEMQVITAMGFPSYFVMVWDLVNFAREAEIAVGPGRGSAAGSIVAYALGITNLDPLRYGLLFERFLNEGRNEMPDIDLDFDKERRPEIIEYIIARHGRERCAQIVTYNCLGAKSAVRDVGRVLGMPFGEVDVIAKMIPDMLKPKDGKSTIEIAMEKNPDLRGVYEKDAEVRELLDIAGQLDGVVRGTGIHASGVLVADKPIIEYMPLARPGDEVTTQYEMKTLEKMGLCKIDVLGLETLTLLRKAVANVRESTGETIDLDAIPLDDADTFAMLGRGEAKGVFQCESSGFRELLTKLRPDCFEDMIAAVALYRPGPLGAGLVETYINCKHGREKPSYLHSRIEPILKETHGLILYQEQVQALAGELAHFTLSEGDLMRRAMGKKIPELMDQYRVQFVEQAADTIGRVVAEKVFDQIDYFAGYGFNKSHSACYGLIAYQTAYLKCHHPVEYMAALLTTNRHNTDKVVEYREDARAMGIEVLPPEINDSDAYFTPAGGSIRFGLSAVKGVGDKAVEAVQAERAENGRFQGLHDFCERIDAKLLNKGAVEALIKAGAFDRLGGHRAQVMAALEGALAAGANARQDRASGQMGLFAGGAEAPEPVLPDVPPWPEPELLRREKEVLGFWVSNHPLARQAERLRAFGSHTTAGLAEVEDGASVTIGGVITEIRLRTDRNDNRYAQLVLSDVEGTVTVWVFNRVFEETRERLKEDAVVFIRGRADRRRDEPTVMAEEVIPMEEAEARLTRCVVLNLEGGLLGPEELGRVRTVVDAHRGEVPLLVRLRTNRGDSVLVRAGQGCRVRPGPELMQAMREVAGEGRLAYSGRSWN